MRMAFAALLIGLSAGSVSAPAVGDPDYAETVEVRLSNFAFSPAEIRLQAGRAYTLRLVDTASGGHDFAAPAFFAAAHIAPEDASRIVKGRIALRGGETALVRLVPAAGTYRLRCTHFGHAAFGMTGRIVVAGAG